MVGGTRSLKVPRWDEGLPYDPVYPLDRLRPITKEAMNSIQPLQQTGSADGSSGYNGARRPRLLSLSLRGEASGSGGYWLDTWDRLRWLFDTDDGGLYDIRLSVLDEAGLVKAFEFIRSRANITPDALFWHTGLQQDQRAADYPDMARLVVQGVAEPFHVLASGLEFASVVLPDLGVYLWQDELTLDYRMGPEWARPQLLALFELLRQLAGTAGGRVGLGRHVLPHVNAQFVREWQTYCAGCGTNA